MTLTGMAARIAGGVVGQRLLNGRSAIDWQPVGVLLGEVLGNMKGPVLKLGQMTSQWQGDTARTHPSGPRTPAEPSAGAAL